MLVRKYTVSFRPWLASLAFVLISPAIALSDNVVHPSAPTLDRPTLTALGVQLGVTGDDNFNAKVSVRFRQTGTRSWYNALPLFRVHPETVFNYTVAPQFSGSIFDLRPATTYDIELHLTDPDGPVDTTFTLKGTTRAVPADPVRPRAVSVNNSASLAAALGAAQPGDVITLANGAYPGAFSIFASGTAENPIVIRGASQDGVVLDAGGCTGCNVLEAYGSWVHIERMTLQNAVQGLRFQAAGAQGNVVRRVHIKNTTLGIGARDNQLDFYIADNILEGRLPWPLTADDDGLLHTSDDGIIMLGQGHVVVHNRISGYSTAVNNFQTGARAIDVNNNDVLWTYNCGVKLSFAEGNARALRNRFTNVFMGMAVQPVYGGPAYFIRNVVVNIASEQMKFHAVGGVQNSDPNGILVYNNTFVSPYNALTLQTPAVSHHFAIENNLFVGPAVESRGVTVDWEGYIDDGLFDYNGYSPDGVFAFNRLNSSKINVGNFAGLQAAGWETHGVLLNPQTFASGLIGPPSHMQTMPPQDVSLGFNSPALNRGLVLPNVSDGFSGSAPDLGALESGCPKPIYGPRPENVDERTEPFGCSPKSAGR